MTSLATSDQAAGQQFTIPVLPTRSAWLSSEDLAPLTQLDDTRSMLAFMQTLLSIVLGLAWGWWMAPSPWALLAVPWIGVQQHGLFILAHEAAHYRLLRSRGLNDLLGRLIGMSSGISMCSYRVIHRLHHNHLYSPLDPDTAIHGGYPRGVRYLWMKLLSDLTGVNAWKNYAYFFGAPALNDDTGSAARPLDDCAPRLKAAARQDRWLVLAAQLLMPIAFLALGGWEALVGYLLLWILPMLTVLQPILRLRAICEHGAVEDLSSPLTAARCNLSSGSASGLWIDALINRIGGVLLFPHHVNHHLEHHLYPAVPHYRLPALHRLLRERGLLDRAEVRDLRSTLSLVFAPRRRSQTSGALA